MSLARRLPPLTLALFLAACSSSYKEEDAGGDSASDTVTAQEDGSRARPKAAARHGEGEGGDDAPDATPGDDAPDGDDPDTSSTPYTKRSGAESLERDPAPAHVAFEAPPAEARPVKPRERPEWPARSRLAIATVRDDEVVHTAKVVLEFHTLLSKEAEVKAVFALGALDVTTAGLKELAKQADAEGRDLLLVDVRPGPPGIKRVGYLIHAAKGTLLDRYEVPEHPVGAPASTGSAADLCARLGVAYARAKD